MSKKELFDSETRELISDCEKLEGLKFDEFEKLWSNLPEMPEISDREFFEGASRFSDTLNAYQRGLSDRVNQPEDTSKELLSLKFLLFRCFPKIVPIAAVLLLSVGCVLLFQHNRDTWEKYEELQKLLTLTLIQQNETSERLTGTMFASQFELQDRLVQQELLKMIATDPSVNVRLSAIQSIQSQAKYEPTRRELVELIKIQKSPLVALTICHVVIPFCEPVERSILLQRIESSCIDSERVEKLKATIQRTKEFEI